MKKIEEQERERQKDRCESIVPCTHDDDVVVRLQCPPVGCCGGEGPMCGRVKLGEEHSREHNTRTTQTQHEQWKREEEKNKKKGKEKKGK